MSNGKSPSVPFVRVAARPLRLISPQLTTFSPLQMLQTLLTAGLFERRHALPYNRYSILESFVHIELRSSFPRGSECNQIEKTGVHLRVSSRSLILSHGGTPEAQALQCDGVVSCK